MAVRTVTFSVQLGTEGLAIAQTVAARLGYNYLDWNDTSRAAIAMGISPDVVAEFERSRPRILRLVESLFTSASLMSDDVTLDATVDPTVMSRAMSSLNSSGYRGFVEDMVRELASQGGSVIVGHSAQVILREDETSFKVLICGEEKRRAQRLALQTSQSYESALSSVRKSDRDRRDFYKRVYGVDPLTPELYDLTIRDDWITRDFAIDGIMAILQGMGVEARASAGEARESGKLAEDLAQSRETPLTSEQDALRQARTFLESAIPGEGKAPPPAQLRDTVRHLQTVFDLHVTEAEAPEGTLADALRKKPYLERRVKRLRDEHVRISREIADLHDDLSRSSGSDFDIDAMKERATRVLVALRLHEASGSDLLYEAYVREEGGE